MVKQRFADRNRDFPSERLPDGRWLCRFCRQPVPLKGRFRLYCSEAHRDEVDIRCGFGFIRYIRERDHGVCSVCGLDCVELASAVRQMRFSRYEWDGSADRLSLAELHSALKAAMHLPRSQNRLWEAHHKLRVADGGGKCGLENYVTLCWRCHKQAHRSRQ